MSYKAWRKQELMSRSSTARRECFLTEIYVPRYNTFYDDLAKHYLHEYLAVPRLVQLDGHHLIFLSADIAKFWWERLYQERRVYGQLNGSHVQYYNSYYLRKHITKANNHPINRWIDAEIKRGKKYGQRR
jgi:hypothetical protein